MLIAGAGARVLQLRLKPASTRAVVVAAQMARRVTAELGALLIVNDRVDVALAIGADGVHIGQDDLPLLETRQLAANMIVGVSTHNLAQVRAAITGGADYIGFGPVFVTSTKANPDPVVGLNGLADAVSVAGNVPVVAIGGIGIEDGPAIAATGAAAACAISALLQSRDIAAAGRRLGSSWTCAI
jgi:thiamine-phosphate pyrophosphorylase